MHLQRFAILTACALTALSVAGASPSSPAQAASLAVELNGPSTFHSTATRDGWVLESTETSSKGGSYSAGSMYLRIGDDAQRRQYRSILSFNTSSLPDNAVASSATLTLTFHTITGGGDPATTFLGMLLDMRKGTFAAPALRANDFQNAPTLGGLGPLSPILVDEFYTYDLPAPALAEINPLGQTQMRLRFKRGDNNDNRSNFISFYSGNSAIDVQPVLNVEWSAEDITPPSAVDLTAYKGIGNSADLNWYAPGDDGSVGTAASYEVVYSTSPIYSDYDWSLATVVTSGIPTPSAAGAYQFMSITDLPWGATYYFNVRAVDAAGNMGPVSNSPSVEIPET